MKADQRINDPDGHYPYKILVALEAIERNAPAGPEGPEDDRARTRDFLSTAIAEASAAYIDAQARHLMNPEHGGFKAEYDTARDVLVDARRRHRANRTGATVVAVRGAE